MAFAGSPTDAAGYCQAARQSLQQGDVDAAISQLQQAIQLDPQNFEAHQLLGVAYGQKGMVNEAMQTLYTAVTLDPNSASARLNYAAALQRAGYLQEAADQLQAALQINPDYDKAQQALQELQAQMRQAAAPAVAAPPERQPTSPEPAADTVACPSCRAQNAPDAQFCWQCGQPMKAGAPRPTTAPVRTGAPSAARTQSSGSSGRATLALVLGILSIVMCGCLTGIPAIIVGKNELKDIDAGGSPAGGRGLAKAGVIMGWISIALAVVYTMIYAALLLPAFNQARQKALQQQSLQQPPGGFTAPPRPSGPGLPGR